MYNMYGRDHIFLRSFLKTFVVINLVDLSLLCHSSLFLGICQMQTFRFQSVEVRSELLLHFILYYFIDVIMTYIITCNKYFSMFFTIKRTL